MDKAECRVACTRLKTGNEIICTYSMVTLHILCSFNFMFSSFKYFASVSLEQLFISLCTVIRVISLLCFFELFLDKGGNFFFSPCCFLSLFGPLFTFISIGFLALGMGRSLTVRAASINDSSLQKCPIS